MYNMETICLIGSGNVATHLAHALHDHQNTPVGICSRTIEHAHELASKYGIATATDKLKNLPRADIYLFAVKDDVLPALIEEAASLPGSDKALFIHTAGSIPLEVFAGKVRHAAVLYPLMTLSKARPTDFSGTPLFVEGNTPESTEKVCQLAHLLSGSVSLLNSEQRALLHLSAVFANNFTNHCFALAYDLLSQAQIPPQVLLPIMDETVQKLQDLSPADAQTGPARRWDTNVMDAHLQKLKGHPEMQEIYRVMSQSIHRLEQARKADKAPSQPRP